MTADTRLITLPNGVRVLTLQRPQVATVSVSVVVASGSVHESRVQSGLHHVLEHMVYKGTARRDARRINLDAETLGAEANAHTDKDHLAFHLTGLAVHGPTLVGLLGDLLTCPVFPAAEVERERQVLLHEFADDQDDPLSLAWSLFDTACWGRHAAAQPVIGTRQLLQRFGREDLLRLAGERFVGAAVVVGVAGALDEEAVHRAAEAAFGSLPPGARPQVTPPLPGHALKTRRWPGAAQLQLLMGWPLPGLGEDDTATRLAATLLGEGMSSPLMQRLREERALAYYAACSADLFQPCGQWVVEASTAGDQADTLVGEVLALVRERAHRLPPAELARARRQRLVQMARAAERPGRELEDAIADLLALGHVRPASQRREALESTPSRQVRQVFETLAGRPPAIAAVGPLHRDAMARLRERHAGLASAR